MEITASPVYSKRKVTGCFAIGSCIKNGVYRPPSHDPVTLWSLRVQCNTGVIESRDAVASLSHSHIMIMTIIIIITINVIFFCSLPLTDRNSWESFLPLRRTRTSFDAKLSAFRWVAPCDARIDFACFSFALCSTARILFLPPPCPVTVCRIIYFLAVQLAINEEELEDESILTRYPSFPVMGYASCETVINIIN